MKNAESPIKKYKYVEGKPLRVLIMIVGNSFSYNT
jgi:hypothetical protein